MDGKRKPAPIYIRLLFTVPIDNASTKEEVDQQYLHDHVMNHVNWFTSFKPSTLSSRSPTSDFHQEATPLDTGT
eukprot:148938-Pyramimonas_sp.AAC.1